MAIDEKIRREKLKYIFNRKAANMINMNMFYR